MEFNIGDKVKLEGVIEANPQSQDYPLLFKSKGGSFSITRDGKMVYDRPICVELVKKAKVKIKKYRVLYEFDERLFVSQDYYKDLNDFKNAIKVDTPLQLLEATEKEFEE